MQLVVKGKNMEISDRLKRFVEGKISKLERVLPGMSEAEVETALKDVIREKGLSSAKDVGLAMKELMARHRGRIDGKRAQEIARRLLP